MINTFTFRGTLLKVKLTYFQLSEKKSLKSNFKKQNGSKSSSYNIPIGPEVPSALFFLV